MYKDEYKDCLDYIDKYWDKITHSPSRMTVRGNIIPQFFFPEKDDYNSIDMPYPFFTPNDRKFKYIFYWDSFFMFRGIMGTKRKKLMKDMVENFMYLFKTYKIIPNFSATASLGRSQPPFLTSMILDAYTASKPHHVLSMLTNGEKSWLKKAIAVAKQEYEIVWIDKARLYNHSVDGQILSRYGDRDVGYAHSSELESGWDFTSRFYNRCNHFLPIDLNSYLYKYECDFAYVAQYLNNKKDQQYWQEKALERKTAINELMWNEKAGFFFDYGWYYNAQSEFYSLAGYTPMWAGLATPEQAAKMIKKLTKFETASGLTITAKESLAKPLDLTKIQRRYHPAIEEIIKPKQWDYPHIWSPLEYLTVIGLLRYNYIAEATRIMKASINAHAKIFRKYGTFSEKIDSTTGEPGVNFHYENQPGFGWTNAAFFRYIQLLDHIEQNKPLFIDSDQQIPPYTLAVLH